MASKDPLPACTSASSRCVNNSNAWLLVNPSSTKEPRISFSFLSSLNKSNGLTSFGLICIPFNQNTLAPLWARNELLCSSSEIPGLITTRRDREVTYFGKFWARWTNVANGLEDEVITCMALAPSSKSSSVERATLAFCAVAFSGWAKISGRTGSASISWSWRSAADWDLESIRNEFRTKNRRET